MSPWKKKIYNPKSSKLYATIDFSSIVQVFSINTSTDVQIDHL